MRSRSGVLLVCFLSAALGFAEEKDKPFCHLFLAGYSEKAPFLKEVANQIRLRPFETLSRAGEVLFLLPNERLDDLRLQIFDFRAHPIADWANRLAEQRAWYAHSAKGLLQVSLMIAPLVGVLFYSQNVLPQFARSISTILTASASGTALWGSILQFSRFHATPLLPNLASRIDFLKEAPFAIKVLVMDKSQIDSMSQELLALGWKYDTTAAFGGSDYPAPGLRLPSSPPNTHIQAGNPPIH